MTEALSSNLDQWAEYASNMADDLSILIVQMRKFLCLKKLKGQLIARLIWERFYAQIIIVQIIRDFSELAAVVSL